MNPKVSIIIPVYNVEDYVARCLESVINQTYTNIEIIVVNDGSEDRSYEICNKYALEDNRIRLIDQVNKGLSGARNTGLEKATGDYICFIDSDDWIELDYISYALSIIEKNNVQLVVVSYFISDENNDTISSKGWISKNELIVDCNDAMRMLVEDKKINSHAWDKIYRRDLFERIKFPEGKNFEDIYIMHEIFALCDKIAISGQPKYHYYVRETSIARNYKTKNILDYFEAEMVRKQFLKVNYNNLIPLQNTKLMELLLSYYPKFKRNGSFSKTIYGKERKLFCQYTIEIINDYNREHEEFTESKFKYMFKIFCKSRSAFRIISPLSNRLIYIIKRSKYKAVFKVLLHKSNDFLLELDKCANMPKYILIGVPEYDNLGDVAIGYASGKFLKKYIPKDRQLLIITENNFWKYFSKIKKCICKDDIIFIQGGGNFGNQYYDQERMRRRILKKIKNKIILMPSTFYLKNFELDIKKYSSFYGNFNFEIFSREEYSYNLVEKYFKNKVSLVPDIVLSLKHDRVLDIPKSGIGLCLRRDIESKLTKEEKKLIKNILYSYEKWIYEFDTCINEPVPIEKHDFVLKSCFKEISSYQLVVTDKLHALIFCAITGTACIAIGNYNHKIKGVYKWIDKLPYIYYVDSISEIESYINRIYTQRNDYSSLNLVNEFEPLIHLMKGNKNEKIY